jgi:hypothetical protein
LYSEDEINSIAANQTKDVKLNQLAPFGGKIVAAKRLVEYGTELDILGPEDYDWISNTAQYPFVLIADGSWDISTSIAPPSGFVPDTTSLSATVADTTSAIQFTLTDVGSAWTQTDVTHVIKHKGTTRIRTDRVRMFNRKPTTAKPDSTTVLKGSSANAIDVLSNDDVASGKTLTITGVTQGAHGSVTYSSTGVSYAPTGGFVGHDSFTYTINDDNGGVDTGTVQVRVSNSRSSITIGDTSVAEGNSGTSTANFTVTLSSAVEIPVEFDYTTADGTAVVGTDYTYGSGTVVIAPGETRATIAVSVIGNAVNQGNRNFNVRLSNVINQAADILDGVGNGVIVDDDQPTLDISAPPSVREGDILTVTVRLSAASVVPATVDYAAEPGTAKSGLDYMPTAGTLTFAPGNTVKTFDVLVRSDNKIEGTETFGVRLSNATGATLGTSVVTVSVIDIP